MKRTLSALAAVALLVTLAACGGGGDEGEAADTPAASTEPDESAYIEAVRADVDSADSDADLVELGYIICDSFAAGQEPDEVVDAGAESGFTAADVRVLMTASIDSLCKDHRDLYDEIN